MATHNISLGNVDVSRLETDEDFRREAKRLLPSALEQVGRAAGEEAWNAIRKAFHGPGMKRSTSPSEKRKFIQESARNYRQKADAKTKREIEDLIVQKLRGMKSAS